ncbi:MAG: MotA/TolQ/ExbB proton channel family protein [Actinomycetia bacterium]|nr:MotA/TolQ/ExbB proton channel family protein [Actinomycetes bacterium]
MNERYRIFIFITCIIVILTIIPGIIPVYPDTESITSGNIQERGTNVDLISEQRQLEQPIDSGTSIFELLKMGGWAIYPLILCSILAVAFIMERAIVIYQAKLGRVQNMGKIYIEHYKNNSPQDTTEKFKNDNYILMKILTNGLKMHNEGIGHMEKVMENIAAYEIAFLEKGLNVLSTIGNIAPLIGFLGTVSGMIKAFQTIASADQVNARLVASGIYEALVTTAFGLIIAIPTLAFHNYFINLVDKFTIQTEKYASILITETLKKNSGNPTASKK